MDTSIEIKAILESIFETAVDGIINIDSQGIIININSAALKLFEYQKEELMGKNISTLMSQPDRNLHDSYIRQYIKTKVPKIVGIGREVNGLTKSGKIFPFRLAVSEVVLNDRIIFTGIIHDLTDLHQAVNDLEVINDDLDRRVLERTNEVEKVVNQLLTTNKKLQTEIKEKEAIQVELIHKENELIEALEAEKELNELKSRFVSTASHEFRTPLATILSSASIIGKYPQAEQQPDREKHIGKIKKAVNHLITLLNDFLSLSKLEEGKQLTKMEVVDITEILNDVIDDLESILKPNQKIITHIDNKIEVSSDRDVLKNIFFNLISNAIKYSEKNIDIKCQDVQDQIEICIEDQGIGISEEDQKYLFERFYRATNVGTIQGTGLGLNIVKKYCQLIGVDIAIQSEMDKGTKVCLKININ